VKVWSTFPTVAPSVRKLRITIKRMLVPSPDSETDSEEERQELELERMEEEEGDEEDVDGDEIVQHSGKNSSHSGSEVEVQEKVNTHTGGEEKGRRKRKGQQQYYLRRKEEDSTKIITSKKSDKEKKARKVTKRVIERTVELDSAIMKRIESLFRRIWKKRKAGENWSPYWMSASMVACTTRLACRWMDKEGRWK